MNRRTLLALSLFAPLLRSIRAQAAAPVATAQSAQDRADLARIEVYLNSLRALHSRFLQVAPDGSTSEGNAWLQRPGRMRFEYDKPSPYLMVAGHGSVAFYDRELNQTTSVPLATTPLGILLASDFKLSGDVTVTQIEREPGVIQVTTTRTGSPNDGTLTLVFADQPLALRQWAVVDGDHQETRVSLFSIELGGEFDQRMFEFNDPRLPGGTRNN